MVTADDTLAALMLLQQVTAIVSLTLAITVELKTTLMSEPPWNEQHRRRNAWATSTTVVKIFPQLLIVGAGK